MESFLLVEEMNVRTKVKLIIFLIYIFLITSKTTYGREIIRDGEKDGIVVAYGLSTEKNSVKAEREATLDAVGAIVNHIYGIKIFQKETHEEVYTFEDSPNKRWTHKIKIESGEDLFVYFKKIKVEKHQGITKVIVEVSPKTTSNANAIKKRLRLEKEGVNRITCKGIKERECKRVSNEIMKQNDFLINNKSRISLLVEIDTSVSNIIDCNVIRGNTVFYKGKSCFGNIKYNISLSLLDKSSKSTIKKSSRYCKNINLNYLVIQLGTLKSNMSNHDCNIFEESIFKL